MTVVEKMFGNAFAVAVEIDCERHGLMGVCAYPIEVCAWFTLGKWDGDDAGGCAAASQGDLRNFSDSCSRGVTKHCGFGFLVDCCDRGCPISYITATKAFGRITKTFSIDSWIWTSGGVDFLWSGFLAE